tara:strand:- start:5793 stop:6452 length:660 start_codon:yes stop_codon:yes gene_type:complete
MGYLDNTSVTVDAVLTKLGRQRLAEGALSITKFALADDEVNYAMYDTSHNLGTSFYGEAIERMPLLEAFTNDPQAMNNKLVTLPKNTQILPVVTLAQSSISLTNPGQTVTLEPQTLNILNANASGYTFTIGNTDIVSMQVMEMATQTGGTETTAMQARGAGYIPPQTGNKLSGTVIGMSVKLTAYSITQTTSTTLTISGNGTGGTVTVPVTISRDTSLD